MDDAVTLVNGAIKEHKGMIKQMKGVPGVLPERLAEGMDPKHCALSLVGQWTDEARRRCSMVL